MLRTPALSRVFSVLTYISIAAYLFLAYRNILVFNYPTAPGGDLIVHYSLFQTLQTQGFAVLEGGYPPLFHILILFVTALTGLGFYQAVLWIMPLVVAGAGLGVGFAARKAGNGLAGAIATSTFLFAATQPHQTLLDGGYPSFIASAILLPLTVTALSLALDTNRKRHWLSSVMLAVTLFLTHHLTGVYLVIISLFLLLLKLPWRKWQTWVWTLVSFTAFYALAHKPLRLITETAVSYSSTYPWISLRGTLDNPNAIWQWQDYGVGIGYLPWTVGILALALTGVRIMQKKSSTLELALTLWTVMLLVGSQTPELGFPVRLARDAAVPLIILAAILLSRILTQTKKRWYQLLIVLAVLVIARPHILENWHRLTHYNERISYSNAVADAVNSTEKKKLAAVNTQIVQSLHPETTMILISPTPTEDEKTSLLNLRDTITSILVIEKRGDNFKQEALLKSAGFTNVNVFHDPIHSVWVYSH